MKKCKLCNNDHNGFYGSGTFCSSSCARKYSSATIDHTKKKKVLCIDCKIEIEVKIHSDPNKCLCSDCLKKRYITTKNKNIVKNICEVCHNEFYHFVKKKTCSKSCYKTSMSKHRVIWLKEHGTSNFATKQDNFSYKFVCNISLNSILEKAAIIYLVDIFGATKIENFNQELFFIDENNVKHCFLTDFYVERNNEKFLIEVKMPWIGTSDHIYNKYIPNKKKALEDYCRINGYHCLWLDLNYDEKFKKIYSSMF